MAELKGYRSNTDIENSPNGAVSNNKGVDANQIDLHDNRVAGTADGPVNSKHQDDKVEIKNGKEKKKPQPMVGLFEVFKFANAFDIFLMVIGSIFAMAHGAMLPCMIIVFGKMIDLFVDSGVLSTFLDDVSDFLVTVNLTKVDILRNQSVLNGPVCMQLAVFYNNTKSCSSIQVDFGTIMLDQMQTFAIYYVIIGCGVMILAYGQLAFWMTAAERQTHRIRMKFFSNLLRQDIGWFDTHESAELNTRLTDDVSKIHDGIGDKMGSLVQWNSCFVAGFAIGFAYGWKLTLVILSISPGLIVSAGLMSRLAASMTSKELKAYAKAGAIAEEVLGAIRTVVAFGGQSKEIERYTENLKDAKSYGIKKGFSTGLSMGFVWLIIFCSYALGFWYGAKLTRDEPETYKPGTMMIVFFSVLIGAFSLGNASPGIQSWSAARGAAYVIFQIIDLVPIIDSTSNQGKKPQKIIGDIEFRNVHFEYPSRPGVTILNGLNLKINQGQTVALVGPSGCGKSTTVQLIQRFYDPGEGSIFIDGTDIRELNIKWLRHHIGIVSQEPILFGTTISENIRYGCDGITQQDIEAASKKANAHDFIMKLPDKYNTLVGERGAQLSGGQKQRVAIARALVSDPKILLLDEATSALDNESESIVQDALDHARQGRTTIVIAHRLSTVQTADSIAGFQDGTIVERGTHSEMMDKQGIYYSLVMNQTKKQENVDEDEEEIIKILERPVELKRMLSSEDKKVARSMSATETKEKEEEKVPAAPFRRIIKMNGPEWPFILFGCFSSLINGGMQPAFAVIFSEFLGVFQKTLEEQERLVSMFCLLLVGLAFLAFLTNLLQGFMFGKSGEELTLRLRKSAFKAMLRQEIAYFDDHKNNVGALTTRLATDASQVQGATGIRLGMVVMNIANMGTALVIAFVYGWKLTLVILAFLPFIAASGAIEMKVLAGVAGKNKEALEGAAKVAFESVENIRTVASLVREPMFVGLFLEKLLSPYHAALKKAHLVGASFGISQAITFFAYAAAFWFGAYLVKEGEMNYVDVFKVFGSIVFGAMAIGQASAFAPDAAKAGVSAQKICMLLDKVPAIDSESTEGRKPTNFSSRIRFSKVTFRYPTRPDDMVLQGLSLSVEPGQTLALVGTSGCGKSTTVQLIERFYEVESGSVNLDSHNIKDLNLSWFRSQIGIVSQEPILFDRSIAENIAYGDNSRVVSMQEIIEAARGANIHSFIASLPDGYETNVGEKGTQLSGGQKQRVAIARALVRNPKILLLDEATSALDTESEKVVQEALDKAQEGRTSIVIAHRLSTIQNADKIVVIKHGQLAEEGSHSSLMAQRGFYYKLNMAQNKQR
ncbi:ATP-dependent translocase ABCB1-like isoform X2 [Gigantopelta aegis]|uniref:ATP-dependent translocase ABCB1-like isoform X2 n=1 Tax=Gigantopelta aegis TaxID=1735272 RepID=UPI001B88E66A|nr:ATP-dependent translocase ABCB1-like isoform X2 [Gigantopelta aegis]